MHLLVLANIGNSDLIADSRRLQRPRADGEAAWQTFEQHTFETPIIEPCVRWIIGRNGRIDRLILFYTDQPATPETLKPDRSGVSLRDKDTLWYARIIERLLRERFGDRIGHLECQAIRRIDGRNINPSIYDEAFDAYAGLVAPLVDAQTTCYVLMAGGIPACNTALQLNAISAFGDRCRVVYQPEGGQPYDLRVGDQVLNVFRRATAIDALERLDFATALPLVRQVADGAVAALVAYAHYRECFDFERAQTTLSHGIRQASGELRSFFANLEHDLDPLMLRSDMGALLRELVANATITFRNGRYADFLGRLFRFQEAALRFIIETKLGLPTDMSKERREVNLPEYRRRIDADSGLKAWLDARTIDGTPLRYDTPNIPTLQAMLDYLIDPASVKPDDAPYLPKDERGRLTGVKQRLDKITSLSQLRNQSVIAHGFAGVSRERLAEVYGGDPDALIADLREIVKLLGLSAQESPFEQIAGIAIEQLRHLT
ncbi:hypothetical protein [Roseiflexus sp.]|uniref:hypothetical protein n=1 Tax=Roseiflexus sp. TaxID=2562120 RepID=UPI0021DD7A2A|nr:hypothetical protein [Roseiflexus sp.]GIW00977.1 MAG: hypothetical protein KatS3mg058_2380 [Roseiflexus sp.]